MKPTWTKVYSGPGYPVIPRRVVEVIDFRPGRPNLIKQQIALADRMVGTNGTGLDLNKLFADLYAIRKDRVPVDEYVFLFGSKAEALRWASLFTKAGADYLAQIENLSKH